MCLVLYFIQTVFSYILLFVYQICLSLPFKNIYLFKFSLTFFGFLILEFEDLFISSPHLPLVNWPPGI